jgi:FkbM family methyltransferase
VSRVKAKIRDAAKGVILFIVSLAGRTRIGEYFETLIVNSAMDKVSEASHKGLTLKLATPNMLCKWRARTFSTKEPETLEWIDAMPEGSVLWDVGANVGLYAVYAAKRRNCQVWAFEPSVFNLELLARNVFLNGMASRVCIVPLALSDRLSASRMSMTSTDWGGALSTFGQNFGWDGELIQQVFEFRTLGLSMDGAMQGLAIPQPDYIKMDVDGIEHLILHGGPIVLQNIKGILIEVNDAFEEQAHQCQLLLTKAGLVLKDKRQSEIIAASTDGFQNAYNQIWARP